MPPMPQLPRTPQRLAPLSMLLAVTLVLAACAANTLTEDGPVAVSPSIPTETSAPVFTPSSRATVAPVRCGNTLLPTSSPSGPSASGSFVGWVDVPALPGTLFYSDTAWASDGVKTSSTSETLGLCTPGVTPAAVTAFYSTRLPANGWVTIATFPEASSCAPHACWMRNAGGGTTIYLALDHLQAADGATLYTLTYLDVHIN